MLLVARSEEEAAHLDQQLWQFQQLSFLPHGTARDEHASLHPILITTSADNANDATVLCLLDGELPAVAPMDWPQEFEMVIDMFDGTRAERLDAARKRWAGWKQGGGLLSYFKQEQDGSWAKSA